MYLLISHIIVQKLYAYTNREVVFAHIGDTGQPGQNRKDVARALKNICQREQCQFVIHSGDIVYDDGLKIAYDKVSKNAYHAFKNLTVEQQENPNLVPLEIRTSVKEVMKEYFEEIYQDIPLTFYMTLGNHDHDVPIGPYKIYAQENPQFYFPNWFYTFEKGDTENKIAFFSIITSPEEDDRYQHDYKRFQKLFLQNELKKSNARWKIVFAHHGWRSFGVERHDARGEPPLEDFYRNTLCQNSTKQADILLVGHNHILEHLKPIACADGSKIQLWLSGAGSKLSDVAKCPETLYASKEFGFSIMKISQNKIKQTFYDRFENELYTSESDKDGNIINSTVKIPGIYATGAASIWKIIDGRPIETCARDSEYMGIPYDIR